MSISYRDAAGRSWVDAEALYGAGRLATPDHLYGLAAECALKAVLGSLGAFHGDALGTPFAKHVDKLWKEYTMYVGGLGRYALLPPISHPFTGWAIDHRYFADGSFSSARVARHRGGAKAALDLLQRARVDGLVP